MDMDAQIIEPIEQKLEQIEKIIQICLQSTLPQIVKDKNNNSISLPSINNTAVLKLFAKQLTLLKECNKDTHSYLYKKYPNLKKWLQLFNISQSCLNELDSTKMTFHDLYSLTSTHEINDYLKNNFNIELNDKEIGLIYNGFQSLRQFSKPEDSSPIPRTKQSVPELTGSIRVKQQRKSESDVQFNSVNKQLKPLCNQPQCSSSSSSNNFSNLSTSSSSSNNSNKNNLTFSPMLPKSKSKGHKVTTPPPFRKNSTGNPLNAVNLNNPQIAAIAAAVAAQQKPTEMQRSSSHESHLRNKIQIIQQNDQPNTPEVQREENNSFLLTGDRRLSSSEKCPSEFSSRCPSGQASPSLQSPSRFSKTGSVFDDSKKMCKSPNLTREHRWSNTFKVTNCDVCNKKLFFLGIKCKNCKFIKYIRIRNIKKCQICHKPLWHGVKCKYCKFRCHKECEKKCTQPCTITSLACFTNEFPIISLANTNETEHSSLQVQHYSNSSSAASSNTASPALHASNFGFTSTVAGLANKIVQSINNTVSTPKQNPKFNKTIEDPRHLIDSRSSSSCNSSEPNSPNYFKQIHNQQFNPHKLTDKKPSFSSISNASMGFFNTSQPQNQLISSVASTTTQTTITPNVEVQTTESKLEQEEEDEIGIDDQNKNQTDLQQFNIQYDEITDKKEIGRGRFGIVYKAYWHGMIACKEVTFNENIKEDSEELINFEEEVLNLRKTRHSNLILFIGAYIKPPKCAIVMSLCRGLSLYKYLHFESVSSSSKVNLDWIIDICIQIAQALGYLHNKQMIHKDLRSKNVFIDGNKAVITDFGLYSIRRLCNRIERDDLIPITKECLYYMAPEVVKLIGTNRIETGFSPASDVYAFGTIWYEMFCHEYPFSSYSTDTVLYLVGNGLKNLSPSIQLTKEFKIILLKCWSKDPSNRPDFSRLLETFRAIPKKTKLFRSPSHPVHINMR